MGVASDVRRVKTSALRENKEGTLERRVGHIAGVAFRAQTQY